MQSRMPLICLDCRYVRPRPSGIGMVVQELIKFLPELAPDWRFLFLRNAEVTHKLSQAPNVEELVLRFGVNTPVSMWGLPRLVDLSQADLFHSPSNILSAGLNMPTVTTIHDLMWLNEPELCNPGAWGKIERVFYQNGIRRALRSSHALIVVSEATRSDVAEYDPQAGERTTTIHSGVAETFRPHSASFDVLPRLGLSERKYVLTIGQNAPYKNHAGAIRGFAQGFAGQPEIQLVLVQRRGEGTATLEKLARELGVKEQVRFVDPVDDETLIQLYSGALALLHPSLCEGFGMPIAEAMACGCPVVTSNRSAMPEVSGGAALLVDPTDARSIATALLQIAGDDTLREQLRAKGLARAAELSWRACAEKHIAVYKQVLDRA